MQADRRRTAGAWRTSAEQHLRVAAAHLADEPNISCFHAQQAGGKALKAAAVAEAGLVIDETLAAAARVLDRYYAPTRYPDAVGDIDPARLFAAQDAEVALGYARTVVRFADSVIEHAFDDELPAPYDELPAPQEVAGGARPE